MRKKHGVTLTRKDRRRLKDLVSKGQEHARTITRGRILLLSDAGNNDTAIMATLDLARNTIRQVCQRYGEEGLDGAIHDKPRSGAPVKFDGKQTAKITALACSKPPVGRSRWTLRLLADTVVELNLVEEISHMQIGRLLKKTNFSPI